MLIAAALSVAAAATPSRMHLAEDWEPPVLEGLEPPAGLTTLTVSPDGLHAAAAVVVGEGGRKGRVLLYASEAEEPVTVEVNGIVRDLLFEPDSRAVLGLLHRPAKRREGDTYLIRIELGAPKPRRLVHLPPSARGMDYWPMRGTLLVAVRNEIRTFTLPGLRSGPLYRVPGENLAVASLGQGSRILIGQNEAMLLVDLDDPPDENAMPVRERRAVSRAVTSLAAANDGTRVLARLEDGSVWSILTSPLRAELIDSGAMLAATERHSASSATEAEPPSVEPEPEPGPVEPEPEPDPTVRWAAPVPLGGEIVEEPRPDEAVGEDAPVEEDDVEEAPASTSPDPTEAPQSGHPTPEADAGVTAPLVAKGAEPQQVHGRIGGPAARMVAHVVLFGPDNILREAVRVSVAPDGHWQARDLAPGRYRIQLDGGGDRVLVTEPAFAIVEIPASGSVEAAAFRVLEAL
jgi:hypothetical protein